jgi:hypothetical protein
MKKSKIGGDFIPEGKIYNVPDYQFGGWDFLVLTIAKDMGFSGDHASYTCHDS